MNIANIKVDKDELTIEDDDNSLISKLFAGCKGKITIKTPFGERKIKKVKKEPKKGK